MKTNLFYLFVLLFAMSCKKEVKVSQDQIASNPLRIALTTDVASDVESGDCIRNWWGKYVNEYGISDTINQHAVIKDGVARCPTASYYNYHSGIYYSIPLCQDISGDNIRIEARVKNPSGVSGSIYDYDVALQLEGRQHTAEVLFVASSASVFYNHLWVGNSSQYGLTSLIHYFAAFENISMEIKHGMQTITRNGEFVTSHFYTEADRIGHLKRIGVGFKGSGITDWVRLYNASTGQLLMSEDFDVNGQSNVIWY